MEKASGFGYHQHPHLMSSNPNLFRFPFDTGHMSSESVSTILLGNAPLFPVSGLQLSKASEPNNSRNWFYGMPDFCQPFACQIDVEQQRIPTMGTAPTQKRFLVFDQSGDKTTLIYSSGVQTTPVQFGTCWGPKPPTTYNSSKEGPTDCNILLRPSMNDEIIEDNSRDVMEDEMHEDTEELDALLYSDDDSDFSEDDEETSTGHSPSTMTDNGILDLNEENGEEVDSFTGPTKRQKLLDGGSLKTCASSVLEGDVGSSCINANKRCKEELGFWSGGKRSRKEKINETLSILQSIIPGVNGKDAIGVLDEAIHYLRSLKVEAKALGLDAL